MKTSLVIALVLVLGLVAYSFINSKQYKFYYFPETNMYYDTRKGQYIYSMDGGKTWAIMGRTTKEIPQVLGEKVVIKSKSPNVWELNPEHRAQYNGVLTDVNVLFESNSTHSAKARKDYPNNKKQNKGLDFSMDAEADLHQGDSNATTDNSIEAEEKAMGTETSIGISEESVLSRSKKKSPVVATPVKKETPIRSDSTQKVQDTTELKTPLLLP